MNNKKRKIENISWLALGLLVLSALTEKLIVLSRILGIAAVIVFMVALFLFGKNFKLFKESEEWKKLRPFVFIVIICLLLFLIKTAINYFK